MGQSTVKEHSVLVRWEESDSLCLVMLLCPSMASVPTKNPLLPTCSYG